MSLSFNNATEVFIFIILFSVYICSILWIYGDAATRKIGIKGVILPLILLIIATVALIKNSLWLLVLWPIAYIAWFIFRPAGSHTITE